MSDRTRTRFSRSTALLASVGLFAFALLVRLALHNGFVLGDDREEFQVIRSLVDNGPSFEGHLRYRFTMWVFNYLAASILGNHEASFFLPTWLLSSLLPVLAFLTLRAAGYGLGGAAFAGAFVALSPFEVLIGGLRANDLFVEFFLACSFFLFVRFQERPVLQASSVSLTLWLAFYAKLWSLFLYPVVGLHYLLRWWRRGEARGLVAFLAASALLHAAACAFWRVETGTWVPFLERLSATYPVPEGQLAAVLLEYPRLIAIGSEHGNTLFGAVPYLLAGALALSLLGRLRPALVARAPGLRLDRIDVWLLCSCLTFFGLLEFFPNNFTFDQYYSVPRIFRYLAPLSFGLSLLAAKRLVDLAPLLPARSLRAFAALGVLIALGCGTLLAVEPTRSHHERIAALRAELRATCPPELVMDWTHALFFRELHLREACPDTAVRSFRVDTPAVELEGWLHGLEPELAPGTRLVTGLVSYVYYGCATCSFRLASFTAPLDARWVLERELPPTSFDREREPVRLWRWTGKPRPAASLPVPALTPAELLEKAIERFDANDYPGARAFTGALLDRFPANERADDAAYFSAVTHWREGDARRTITEFQRLLARFPSSPWTAAAHYHIGLALRVLGRPDEARQAFAASVQTARLDDPERQYSLDALAGLRGPAPFPSFGSALTELVYRLQAEATAFEGCDSVTTLGSGSAQ